MGKEICLKKKTKGRKCKLSRISTVKTVTFPQAKFREVYIIGQSRLLPQDKNAYM